MKQQLQYNPRYPKIHVGIKYLWMGPTGPPDRLHQTICPQTTWMGLHPAKNMPKKGSIPSEYAAKGPKRASIPSEYAPKGPKLASDPSEYAQKGPE